MWKIVNTCIPSHLSTWLNVWCSHMLLFFISPPRASIGAAHIRGSALHVIQILPNLRAAHILAASQARSVFGSPVGAGLCRMLQLSHWLILGVFYWPWGTTQGATPSGHSKLTTSMEDHEILETFGDASSSWFLGTRNMSQSRHSPSPSKQSVQLHHDPAWVLQRTGIKGYLFFKEKNRWYKTRPLQCGEKFAGKSALQQTYSQD